MTRNTVRLTFAAVLSSLLLSCSGLSHCKPPAVEHVVLCWLKDPGDEGARDKVIEASKELRSIPSVRTLNVGTALASGRGIVDDSFDVGLVIGFGSEAELAEYLVHPEHIARVEGVFAPLSERIVVYDILGR